MRIQPWMTAVASMLLVVAVQTDVSGQSPVPPGSMPPGWAPAPSQGGYTQMPYQHQPPYATNHPQQIHPPGAPGEYQHWPQVSPFYSPNVAMDQHYNRDGVWFRDIVHRQRNYYGSIELMSVAYRDSGSARIGSPYVEFADFGESPIQGVPANVGNLADFDVTILGVTTTSFFPVGNGVFPIPALDNGTQYNSQPEGWYYPVRNLKQATNLGRELGVQLRWGFDNEDGTGMMVNGWWAFDDAARFKAGSDTINGVPVTQQLSLLLGAQNLFIHGTLPLYTGEPIAGIGAGFAPGRTAKFDTLFEFSHATQAGGTNVSFYTQPIYKQGGVQIRPLYGARYTYIDERFNFRGIDSGLRYDLDDETWRPDGAILVAHDQYEARLQNQVRSHIAGPEIGLRFDLGENRKNFRVWGESIFGLQANYEDIRLSGNNIGDPLYESRFENIDNPRMLDPNFESEFSDKRGRTHVSPLYQQSIFAEFPFFRNLPMIRNASIFEETSFRFGYTFLLIGEVARPADAINWQGFPLYPEIRSNRKAFWMHQLNFAIDWTF